MADGAPVLHEDGARTSATSSTHDVGDVDAAFAAAAHVFEERLKIHRYHGMPLETRGVLADWDPARDHLTVWSSTQFPHALKQFVTGMLGLPRASGARSSRRTSAAASASSASSIPRRSCSASPRAAWGGR